MQKRWKSLRDCFHREMRIRRNVENSPTAVRGRQYSYFEQLLFLKPIVEKRTLEPNVYPRVSLNQKQENENEQTQNENEPSHTENENGPTQSGSELAQNENEFENELAPNEIEIEPIQVELSPNSYRIDESRNNRIPNYIPRTKSINRKRLKINRRKRPNNEYVLEAPNPRLIRRQNIQDNSQYDNDMLFLMSLHQDLKSIDDFYKLEAKTEIINVIRKYKTSPQYNRGSFYEDRNQSFLRGRTMAQSEQMHEGQEYFIYQDNLEQFSSPSSVEEKPNLPSPSFLNTEACP